MTGAVVMGSDYRGLGAVQSLGRRGVDVWVLHEARRGVADFSRYAKRSMRWPAGSPRSRVYFLLELAERHGLQGWVLFPTHDETVALCARHWDTLARVFRMTTPPWEIVKYAHDKRQTYRLAAEIGTPYPATWELGGVDIHRVDCTFPAILKPAVKDQTNALTVAKAWRVDDSSALRARYREALQLLPADELLVQELVLGDGGSQLSFAALASDGEVICSLTARRVRQYPMDFGRASTFVETVEDPDVALLGRHVINRLRYTGLVEVEFKRDPQTNEPKLLDVNPRLWGWHTLGRRAGMDFSFEAWRLAQGLRCEERQAPPNIRWMWPAADIPVAVREILAGRLHIAKYLRSFHRPVDFATLTFDDPLPGIVELPLQFAGKLGHSGPDAQGRPAATRAHDPEAPGQ
jgi:D-aspartate ligase